MNQNDGGPDVGRIIEKAIKHRLEAHHRVNPERIDDILNYARKNVSVKMTARGWDVVEHDVQNLFEEIGRRPGWQIAGATPESDDDGWSVNAWTSLPAKERLRLSNRGVRYDEQTGRYHTVIER